MNDLSKKEETHIEEKAKALSANELLQKKLENFLLLYYQAYLKGETEIEPEVRTAFLSVVVADEDFAFKVRMMQLDYLNVEHKELEGQWNEEKEVLFPTVEVAYEAVAEARKKTLMEYSETILDVLRSSGELRP